MRRLCVLGAAVVMLLGCNESNKRLNSPPHGHQPEETSDMQGTFTYMSDNAMLADMTMTDMHFYPHRPMLNSMGENRLSRFASLMDAYGGQLRLSTDSTDGVLISGRLEAVREFLAETGIPTTAQVIVRDMPGGRGMDADEAILIRATEGTYNPETRTAGASENDPEIGGNN